MDRRQKAILRIRAAKHQRKPDAPNTTVFRDHRGNWLFEVYSPKHIGRHPT